MKKAKEVQVIKYILAKARAAPPKQDVRVIWRENNKEKNAIY